MSKTKSKRRRRFRIRRKSQPGMVPGTIEPEPSSPPSVIEVICYGPDGIEEKTVTGASDLKPFLAKWPVTWINVDGFGDGTTIQQLGEFLGLHRLALEDVVNLHQRPKIDDYDQYLFIVAQMMKLDDEPPEQLSIFLGRNFVATFSSRHDGDCFNPVRERIRKSKGHMRNAGPDYLAYALLDALVDVYFPILERLSERIDAIELHVDGRTQGQAVMGDIHDLRNELLVVRRAVWPLRDALNTVIRETHELISPETRVFFRDCYDHTVQIIDLSELYRDLCSDLRDYIISLVSQRTNEIMKVLTIMSSIFIPLGFVAGLYGMNFDQNVSPWNMPELKWYFGYPFAISLMLSIAGGLLCFFKRKGWLW